MRGTYSIAALAALEDEGLSACFSLMCASSAGALNSAYYLAGQANAAVDVYIDHLSNRRFVNPLRVWRIMDIDYLVDEVLTKAVPLDVDGVRSSATELRIVLTDAVTGDVETVDPQDPAISLMEALRATAALPVLFGREVRIGDRKFVDGGLRGALPLELCLEANRDILVILTRPITHRRVVPGEFVSWGMRTLGRVWQHSPGVVKWLGAKDPRYNQNMEILNSLADAPKGVRIWIVEPSDLSRLVDRTTTDRQKLLDTAMLAKSDMRNVLRQPPAVVG